MRKALLLLLVSLPSLASHVVKVTKEGNAVLVSHDFDHEWKAGDAVMIMRIGKSIAYGAVVKVVEKGALVRLSQVVNVPNIGDLVTLGGPGLSRKPSEVPKGGDTFLVGGGLAFGLDRYYPFIGFQVALSENFALGLNLEQIAAVSKGGSSATLGALLTGNFYSKEDFKGLWVRMGLGPRYSFVSLGDQNSSAASFSGLLTVGWRGRWDPGLSLGLSGGVSATTESGLGFDTKATGIYPLFLIDLGLSF